MYDISVPDDVINAVWQHPAFTDDITQQHLKVYYTMNDDTDYGKLRSKDGGHGVYIRLLTAGLCYRI